MTFQWDEGKCSVLASGVLPFPLRGYYNSLAWQKVAFPVSGVLLSIIYAHQGESYYSLGWHIATTLKGTAAIPLQWEKKLNTTIPSKAGVLPFPCGILPIRLRGYYHGLAWGRVAFPVRGVLLSMPTNVKATIPLESILPLSQRGLLLFPCGGKRRVLLLL